MPCYESKNADHLSQTKLNTLTYLFHQQKKTNLRKSWIIRLYNLKGFKHFPVFAIECEVFPLEIKMLDVKDCLEKTILELNKRSMTSTHVSDWSSY